MEKSPFWTEISPFKCFSEAFLFFFFLKTSAGNFLHSEWRNLHSEWRFLHSFFSEVFWLKKHKLHSTNNFLHLEWRNLHSEWRLSNFFRSVSNLFFYVSLFFLQSIFSIQSFSEAFRTFFWNLSLCFFPEHFLHSDWRNLHLEWRFLHSIFFRSVSNLSFF